jgi:mercuric ion binding protein
MRGLAYAIAAIAAVGIMFVIATMPGEQSSDPTATPATAETQTAETQTVAETQAAETQTQPAESAEVLASTTDPKAETESLTLAVPKMHCEFACFPKVKETLESVETVELVELGPQKEEGAIDNRQVIVKFKPGFDVNDAVARLTKAGFGDSEVVQ